MSKVKKNQKYVNENQYNSSITNPSKVERYAAERIDWTKAKTLCDWLFLKHQMSYKTYRGKSKARRHELREEYERDAAWDRAG